MVSYAVRLGLGAVASVLAFVGLFCLAALWRLSAGPVPVDRILPYLSDAVSARAGFRIGAEGADLIWDREIRRAVLRLHRVSAATGNGVTRLNEVEASYRLRALMRGAWLPTELTVRSPSLILMREADGGLAIGLAGSGTSAAAESAEKQTFDLKAVLAPLMAPGAAHLDQIRVVEASAALIDERRGLRFEIPRLDAAVERTRDGLSAQFAAVVEAGGARSRFEGNADFDETPAALRAELRFEGVVPSLFAEQFPDALAAAKGAALPLSGRIAVAVPLSDIERIGMADLARAGLDVEVTGGAGVVLAPDPLGMAYPLESLKVKAHIDGAAGRAVLETAAVELKQATLSAAGTASWTATPRESGLPAISAIKAEVRLKAARTAVAAFEHYWPPGIAENARAWLVENLKDGVIDEANFTAAFAGSDPAAVDITAFSGEGRIAGATVHYLRPMPPITGASGRVTFGLKEIDVFPDGGRCGSLTIAPGGRIKFTGLDQEDQFADIEADISGPVRDTLILLDKEPLHLLKTMRSISPGRTAGEGTTHLVIKFPLLLDLRVKDMTVKAQSTLKAVEIQEVLPHRDLSQGAIGLHVDLDGLTASGLARINGVPVRLTWDERFSGMGIRSRYRVSASLDDDARKALMIDFFPFQEPYVRGIIAGDLLASEDAKGMMTIEVEGDLSRAVMTVPGLGWRKEAGAGGTGSATVRMIKGRLVEISQFRARTDGGFDVQGSATADGSGDVKWVEIARAKFGRNDVTGDVTFGPDGSMVMSLRGPVLDLAPTIGDDGWKELVGDDDDKPEKVPPAAIRGHFERIWTSEKGGLGTGNLDLERLTDGRWLLAMNGLVGAHRPFSIAVKKGEGGGPRRLEASSDDAGAVLRAFDLTNSVLGGRLSLSGQVDDDSGVAARARIEQFRVVDAPIVARLVSVASLTGIPDMLSGGGVSFWYMDAPFTLRKGKVALKDFKAAGSSFGVTANGTVDLDSRAVDLKGVVVPVNVLNRVIADLPVLGPILGGKDGGLFAMNYTIRRTLEDPDVSVNPLTALVPGGIQSLFSWEGEKKPDGPPPDAGTAPGEKGGAAKPGSPSPP